MDKICEHIISQNYSLQDALHAIQTCLSTPGTSKETRGDLGELAVLYTLLALHKQYPEFTKVYHSALMKKKNSEWTNEIDFIFVTPFAVFVIEAKSFYGDTTLSQNHMFTVQNKYGTKSYDVVYQNQQHCKTLYQHIYPYVKGAVVVRPIVTLFSIGTITDKRTSEQRNEYPVLNVENLYNYISKVIHAGISTQMKPKVNYPKCLREIDRQNIQSKDNMLEHINRIKKLR